MSRQAVQLDDLTVNNLGVLKKVNSVVLPTTYGEAWYKESLNVGQLAKLGFYNELPVGAIRCSLETPQNHNQPTKIYIMTLAVLAPYRNYGIGTKLLNHILEQAKEMYVTEVYVHVFSTDNEALEWYEKRGFEKGELIKEYYKKMEPKGDAYVMTKKIE